MPWNRKTNRNRRDKTKEKKNNLKFIWKHERLKTATAILNKQDHNKTVPGGGGQQQTRFPVLVHSHSNKASIVLAQK